MARWLKAVALAALVSILFAGCTRAAWQPLWSTPLPGSSAVGTAATSPQATSMSILELFQKDADSMKNPKVVVLKSKRLLELYDGDTLMARMKIALGTTPEGAKTKDGDGKTPEGSYYICATNANSKHYKSLCISYPNEEDALRGLGLGLISESEYDSIVNAIEAKKQPNWKTALGGEIAIHGLSDEDKDKSGDWTVGNIAVTNEQMDYLWKYLKKGAEVVIQP